MADDRKIRWLQRFGHFQKALNKLDQAVRTIKVEYADDEGKLQEEGFLSEILREGLIQRFEYTHELAWKVMKDFLQEVGSIQLFGSKDATKEAFASNLIQDGEVWMDMIKSRNQTSHIYNENTADEIFGKIMTKYHAAFLAFKDMMEEQAK